MVLGDQVRDSSMVIPRLVTSPWYTHISSQAIVYSIFGVSLGRGDGGGRGRAAGVSPPFSSSCLHVVGVVLCPPGRQQI